MKTLRASAVVGLAVFGLLASGAAATAAPSSNSVNEADIQIIRQNSAALGMTQEATQRVIDNFAKGQLPLSSTSDSPVSTRSAIEGKSEVTYRTFADGSISKSSLEIPTRVDPTKPRPRSVTGCQDQPGVGSFPFTNCTVTTQQPTYRIEFQADGVMGTNGSAQFAGSINRIFGTSVVTAGSASGPTNEILQQNADLFTPARARASYIITAGVGSTTISLTFYVQGGNRWDTSP